ncbi:AAA family ATPase [Tropicibacter sp. Alg240-R139]|uniref:AAA family ATPase n=1 Tax=Tropicibacter sp. Alg240-R139 TaxID=2305991 RepID=UPI0013DEC900|nr:AAA family ATPase [Tropicibacter sp. Alg240-R139]
MEDATDRLQEILGPNAWCVSDDADFSDYTDADSDSPSEGTPEPIPDDADGVLVSLKEGFERKKKHVLAYREAMKGLKAEGKIIDFSDGEFILDNFDRVEGLVPMRGRVGLLGKFKAGKSVVATALGMHIATGMDIGERFVEQGVVVHIMSEGDAQRNKNRLLAWCRHHNVSPVKAMKNYKALSVKYDLLKSADELMRDVTVYAGKGSADVVIIDPLIENFSGKENDSDDMIKFLNHAHIIAKKIEGVVIIPHHLGMDASKGARGSTAYEGAMDMVLQVTGSASKITVKSSASRDQPGGDGLTGAIHSHAIGKNSRGRDVSAPVFVFGETLPEGADAIEPDWYRKLTENQLTIVNQLFGHLLDHKANPEETDFVETLIALWPGDGADKTKRQSITRAIGALKRKEILQETGTTLSFSFEKRRSLHDYLSKNEDRSSP